MGDGSNGQQAGRNETMETITCYTREAYNAAADARRQAISRNAGRHFANNPVAKVPVPPKPVKPKVVQVFCDGAYEGTFPVGTTKEEAIEMARESGLAGRLTAKLVDANL